MSVVLLILKIIGIALLCILGLILLILTLVLWVPIRYSANIVYQQTVDLHAGVTWLLKLLNIRFDYTGNESALSVRVFGIRLPIGEKKDAAAEDDTKPKEETDKQKEPGESEEAGNPEDKPEDSGKPKDEAGKAEDISDNAAESVPDTHADQTEASAEGAKEDHEGSGADGAQDAHAADPAAGAASRDVQEKKKETSAVDKLKHLFLETNRGQRALSHILKYLGKILKSILPKKGSGYVRYGFDSPSATGKVLGFLCTVYPPGKNRVAIRPEFLEPCFDCDMTIEGRIIPGVLLVLAVMMVLNRDVLHVIRTFISK